VTSREPDPLNLLARALDQAGSLIAGTAEDQADLPTPCRSWDVTNLVEHLVHTVGQFSDRVEGDSPDWQRAAAPVEGDPAEAFRSVAQRLMNAWHGAGDLDQPFDSAADGAPPKSFSVAQQTAEVACHAWDLAVATGQPYDGDPAAVAAAHGFAASFQPPDGGAADDGGLFGPPVPVPDDAPALDRLLGATGRDPRWSPPSDSAA